VELTGVVNVVGPPVTLAPQQAFATGAFPSSVAVADLNGDGKPDLAVANPLSDSVSVLLTILESDPPPTVQFATAAESVRESGGSFSVTVSLTGATTEDTTVPFTLAGTAVAGADYSGVTASPLVIPAGQASATITGTLIDDGKFSSPNKTLIFTLGAPSNATLGAVTTDTLTIVDSSPAPASLGGTAFFDLDASGSLDPGESATW
jgi:hypothetical protein